MNQIQKNAHGSVKPYTRHLSTCPHATNKDYNGCRCPKWLYIRYGKGLKQRVSLSTPSWAEAQRIAADKLYGMDPEIAKARAAEQAAKEKQDSKKISVGDAWQMWLDRTERKFGKEGVYTQYQSIERVFGRWAMSEGIMHIDEITPLHLERWYSSQRWLKLSPVTRAQRWGVLRSVFAYWHSVGAIAINPIVGIKADRASKDHVQGPYTETQVDAVFACVAKSALKNVAPGEDKLYVERLEKYLTLLLHTGCDVSDGIVFEPARITDENVDGRVIPIYRYRRRKTKVEAIIPLSTDVAAKLRSVPVGPRNSAAMPFRTEGAGDIAIDGQLWSRRVKRCLELAGVQAVELPGLDHNGRARKKSANTKMLRHTFAVRQLRDGQRPEEVAKMLGHVDTTMVRLHYAPWVQELDTAHIRRVVSEWKR